MTEILLGPRFWNKVFQQVEPSLVVAVKKIKGANSNKAIPGSSSDKLIPSEYCLKLNSVVDNEVGFLLKEMLKYAESLNPCHYTDQGFHIERAKLDRIKTSLMDAGITGTGIRQLEKAILKVAIREGSLPETALYAGQYVIEQRKQEHISKSTSGFGFAYFIRNDNIYKIGITDNLLRRLKELKPSEILNTVRCSNYQEIEKTLHSHFKEKRIPQTEYFRLEDAEIEEAHALMTGMARY